MIFSKKERKKERNKQTNKQNAPSYYNDLTSIYSHNTTELSRSSFAQLYRLQMGMSTLMTPNSFYVPIANSINMLPALMLEPSFNKRLPPEMNLVRIGGEHGRKETAQATRESKENNSQHHYFFNRLAMAG